MLYVVQGNLAVQIISEIASIVGHKVVNSKFISWDDLENAPRAVSSPHAQARWSQRLTFCLT
jgi:hypothetical protein